MAEWVGEWKSKTIWLIEIRRKGKNQHNEMREKQVKKNVDKNTREEKRMRREKYYDDLLKKINTIILI